jgi:hypothetical protein
LIIIDDQYVGIPGFAHAVNDAPYLLPPGGRAAQSRAAVDETRIAHRDRAGRSRNRGGLRQDDPQPCATALTVAAQGQEYNLLRSVTIDGNQ